MTNLTPAEIAAGLSEARGKLVVDWRAFGNAIRAQALVEAKHLTDLEGELGLSHARLVNAAQGKPVGTEIFLTLCHWMQQDPMHFAVRAQLLGEG